MLPMDRYMLNIRSSILTKNQALFKGLPPVTPVSRLAKLSTGSRRQSTVGIYGNSADRQSDINHKTAQDNESKRSGLKRLSTSTLLRILVLGKLFTNPFLFKPAFWALQRIASSRSRLLNADRNPLLRVLIKPLVYDQFCAGRNETEVTKTREKIKSVGYSGVILCYGREVVIGASNSLLSTGKLDAKRDVEIAEWRNGNLKTLDMIGTDDWLGIKWVSLCVSTSSLLMIFQIHWRRPRGNKCSDAPGRAMSSFCSRIGRDMP